MRSRFSVAKVDFSVGGHEDDDEEDEIEQGETAAMQQRGSSSASGSNVQGRRGHRGHSHLHHHSSGQHSGSQPPPPSMSPDNEPQSPTTGSGSTYDTHNIRSLRHMTREPLPRAAHYRDVRSIHTHLDRPTLDELHNPPDTVSVRGSLKVGMFKIRKNHVLKRQLLIVWNLSFSMLSMQIRNESLSFFSRNSHKFA